MKSRKVSLFVATLLLLLAAALGGEQLVGQAVAQDKPASTTSRGATPMSTKVSSNADPIAAIRELYPEAFAVEDTWVNFVNDSDFDMFNITIQGRRTDGATVTKTVLAALPAHTSVPNFDLKEKFVTLKIYWQGEAGRWRHGDRYVASPGKYIYWITSHWPNFYTQEWKNANEIDIP